MRDSFPVRIKSSSDLEDSCCDDLRRSSAFKSASRHSSSWQRSEESVVPWYKTSHSELSKHSKGETFVESGSSRHSLPDSSQAAISRVRLGFRFKL